MRENSHVSFLGGWSGSNPGLATLLIVLYNQRVKYLVNVLLSLIVIMFRNSTESLLIGYVFQK